MWRAEIQKLYNLLKWNACWTSPSLHDMKMMSLSSYSTEQHPTLPVSLHAWGHCNGTYFTVIVLLRRKICSWIPTIVPKQSTATARCTLRPDLKSKHRRASANKSKEQISEIFSDFGLSQFCAALINISFLPWLSEPAGSWSSLGRRCVYRDAPRCGVGDSTEPASLPPHLSCASSLGVPSGLSHLSS